jgi:hypothetical protein
MIDLEDIVTKLNQTVHALHEDFETEELTTLLKTIKDQYGIMYRHCSLTAYYGYKIEETLLYKKRSLLFHDFEAAAEYRDLERSYRNVLKRTKANDVRYKSKFFVEGETIVFCFDEDNEKNARILSIMELL